jgi:hypothetical protein
MEIATIMTLSAFIFITFGLGYTALLLTKPKPIIDTVLLSLVIGLGMLPLAILALRILHVPMDLLVLILLAAVGPVYGIIKAKRMTGKVTPTRYIAIGVVLIAATLIAAMMYIGATKYPYLENDDPWGHAIGAHYVSIEKTTGGMPAESGRYLEPYPPYYTAMMGMLHQWHADLHWVLKFFNALIIGMSIIAAFYAFEALMKDPVRAAAGAVILGVLPAYMSHFIWSQTLAIPVFLIAVWALLSIEPAKKWHTSDGLPLAMLLIWSATIIQPSSAAVAALFLVVLVAVYAGITYYNERRLPLAHVVALIGGGILSFLTWLGFVIRYGWETVSKQIGINAATLGGGDTSGGIIYSIKDIVFAPSSSKIDQATGLGWLVTLFLVIGVIILLVQWRKLFRQKNANRLALLLLLIISLMGIQGNALPFKLFPHRFWVFLAIPVALLAADAIAIIASMSRRRALELAIVTALVAAVVLTSIGPRIAVQQAMWPPGTAWSSNEEIMAYVEAKQQFPLQTKAISLCGDDSRLVGMNMHSEPWRPEAIEFKQGLESMTGDTVIAFMETNGYEYAVLDARCVQLLGGDGVERLGASLSATQRFIPTINKPGIIFARLQ